jgi:ribonuclease P protein component
MLKKQNRLSRINKNKPSEFFVSPIFNIRVSENKEGKTRFGVVVSKKTSKKAVLRNKTKRIVRDIIQKHIEIFLKDKDIIIVIKKVLNKTIRKEAEEELFELLKKTKTIK